MMVDIANLAERTVKFVTKLGASHCDAVVSDSRHIVAEIERSSIKQSSTIEDSGVGIRAFVKGCSGFAYTTGHDFASIRRAASLAVSQATAGTPDTDFKDLPGVEKSTKVDGLFEKRLVDIEPSEVVGMAMELADVAGNHKKITSVNVGVATGWGDVALANSHGISLTQKLTAMEMSVETVAGSGAGMHSATDVGSGRRIESGMVDRVGKSALEHAIRGLRRTKIPTGDYPVVIDPLAAGYILMAAVGVGANAESVQRKRSYLAGSLGRLIGSPLLTIADDPTIPWATGSTSFDGEGVPAKRMTLVENGKLKSLLHDSYTAGKDSIKSTGNSSRGGSLWSFRHPPTISSSNIVVKKGQHTLDEMIAETRKGVLLRLTFDHPNLATGELSALIMEGYAIRDGEMGPSVRQSTMGISLFDMFSRIDMVGKTTRTAYGVKAPALRISSARIGGSG